MKKQTCAVPEGETPSECHQKNTSLEDCSGCTDPHSEGTHQMHTKQHPCKDGGDPNCGYCFPEAFKKRVKNASTPEKQGAAIAYMESKKRGKADWEEEFMNHHGYLFDGSDEIYQGVIQFIHRIEQEAYERGKADGIVEEGVGCFDHCEQAAKEAREDERRKVVEIVEKHLGAYKSMTGSMGYQGLINGITAIQTYQDQQRDKIIEEARTGSKSEGDV